MGVVTQKLSEPFDDNSGRQLALLAAFKPRREAGGMRCSGSLSAPVLPVPNPLQNSSLALP
jgi:hypothetical protein